MQTWESFVASASPAVVGLEQLGEVRHWYLVMVAAAGLPCSASVWLASVWLASLYQAHSPSDQALGSWWVSRRGHLAQLIPHLQDLLEDVVRWAGSRGRGTRAGAASGAKYSLLESVGNKYIAPTDIYRLL